VLPLPFKLLLTALLIVAATLSARRYGPSVGGWLIGLPLTSGPVSLFLALEQGREFAAQAALGSLASLPAVATFNLVYARVACRARWFVSLLAALGGFFVVLSLCRALTGPALAVFALAVVSFALALALLPAHGLAPARPLPPARWDLPLRVLVALTLVLALTETARALGARSVGLLSPFPVFTTVLAAFAHRQAGAAAAVAVVRGVVIGCFGFATFFVLVALLLVPGGVLLAYGSALLGALFLNGTSLWLMRRRARM
jgi:hypothetical protein